MAQFFIHRPIFAWVIALVIMLAGIITLTKMPVAQYPTISPPSVTISATYPGASAQTVENTVTQIIEQQMNGLDGLRYISSNSAGNGQASINLNFEQGIDPDIAQVQVQNKLQSATALLPEDVQRQGLKVTKSGASADACADKDDPWRCRVALAEHQRPDAQPRDGAGVAAGLLPSGHPFPGAGAGGRARLGQVHHAIRAAQPGRSEQGDAARAAQDGGGRVRRRRQQLAGQLREPLWPHARAAGCLLHPGHRRRLCLAPAVHQWRRARHGNQAAGGAQRHRRGRHAPRLDRPGHSRRSADHPRRCPA